MEEGPAESVAGARSIALPPVLIDEPHVHLDELARPGSEGLVFVGESGSDVRNRVERATGIEPA